MGPLAEASAKLDFSDVDRADPEALNRILWAALPKDGVSCASARRSPGGGVLMQIAILTFQGCNEIDSFVALNILGRVRKPGWRVSIASPSKRVVSMNGVVLEAGMSLSEASGADAVIVGSGVATRELVADPVLLSSIDIDPARQLIGAQCSGALVLAKLGLLHGIPACTDLTTKPWVQEAGVEVLNRPFYAKGNIATAGGCLASQYLAGWVIARLESVEAAESALHYVAPVGEAEQYVARALENILPFLPEGSARNAAAG
jgi:transcriptional regulator GlxA family with amidase domain